MSEEEKEAIEFYKNEIKRIENDMEQGFYYGEWSNIRRQIKYMKTIFCLIEKQQAELKKKNEIIAKLSFEIGNRDMELEKKDKKIDLMAEDKYNNVNMYQMADMAHEIGYSLQKLFSGIPDEEVLEIIKQYFEKKVEG